MKYINFKFGDSYNNYNDLINLDNVKRIIFWGDKMDIFFKDGSNDIYIKEPIDEELNAAYVLDNFEEVKEKLLKLCEQ